MKQFSQIPRGSLAELVVLAPKYLYFRQADFTGLLVEVLVSLLQVKENLFSTFGRWSTRDPIVDASQKLLEQRLQLYLIFN